MGEAQIIELVRIDGSVRARELRRQEPHPFRSAGAFVMAASGRHDADDFDRRVLERRVDLVARIRDGIPPLEYLPASEGMLLQGKRHLIAAPRKEGKSIGMLVHWARMALAEAQVVILDRENGANTYAGRLDSIMTAWDLHQRDKTRLGRNLHYYEFPQLRSSDGSHLAEIAKGASVVVFDSQRMFLTDLDLKEGEADDYSEFMRLAVEPLFQAGVATVILDNTGHSDKTRSRGSSAKGDLNEVLFTLKTANEFSPYRQGKLRLILEPGNSRFGNEGEWEMHIGGGAFSPWTRVGEERPVPSGFREAALTALAAAGLKGLSQTKLLNAVKDAGHGARNEDGRAWLYQLAADHIVEMIEPDKPGLPAMFYGGRSSDAA